MTAHNQAISMKAGDSRKVRFVCSKPDGQPIDLTGGSAVLKVSRYLNAPTVENVLSKSCTIDMVTLDGTPFWRVSTDFIPSETATLEPRIYWHECIVTLPGNLVYTVADGPFTIEG